MFKLCLVNSVCKLIVSYEVIVNFVGSKCFKILNWTQIDKDYKGHSQFMAIDLGKKCVI